MKKLKLKPYFASMNTAENLVEETILAKVRPHEGHTYIDDNGDEKYYDKLPFEERAKYVHELILLARRRDRANLEIVQRIAAEIKELAPQQKSNSDSTKVGQTKTLLSFSMYWPAFQAIVNICATGDPGMAEALTVLDRWKDHWGWWFAMAYNSKKQHFIDVKAAMEGYGVDFTKDFVFSAGDYGGFKVGREGKHFLLYIEL